MDYYGRTAACVHPERPAEASVGSEVTLAFNYDSGQRVESHGKIEYHGNAQTIEMQASARVTLDGAEDFSKTWSGSFIRKFI